MADTTTESLEEFRKRETELLVRRRFEVAEVLYSKAITTGDPRLAKAYLEVTGPMVKETEKTDPLLGLPRVEISIHYGSMTLTASPEPKPPSTAPQVLEMVEEVEDAVEVAPLPAPEPDLPPEPPPANPPGALIDAATLARLLED